MHLFYFLDPFPKMEYLFQVLQVIYFYHWISCYSPANWNLFALEACLQEQTA